MAAFFIVSIQLDNPAARPLYDAYIKNVRPIVERHGGRYLVRTERLAHLAGDWRPDRVIMIRFPDIQDLRLASVRSSAVIAEDD